MRVTMVSRIYRPEPSAASFFLGSVADALLEKGHEVDVLTAKPPRGLESESHGERVRTFPVLRDRSGYVRGYLQYLSFDAPLALRLLCIRRPDVVFVEPPPTTGAVVRFVCALRRIPYVYDAADIWSDAAVHATSSKTIVKLLRGLERLALRGARHITTISQGVVTRLQELSIRVPVTITGFGANVSAFEYSGEPIQPRFIYAGTYSELHGASVLIEAFALFSATHPGYRLRFIGQGTEQATMRARAQEMGIADTVEFLDPVPADELQPQLASSLASLATLAPGGGYEYAFASKIYSALATGCPVLFAGPGPTGQFIEEAAAYAPVGTVAKYDAPSIAQAMRDIADDPMGPDQRSSIAEWIRKRHSMQAVARRVTQVITQVASDWRTKP